MVDPFRAPATRYGPGNRGVDYATAAGSPVLAAAAGRVVYAGAVAGSLHVTILHMDGVRTSYSFLASIRMHRGDHVLQGDIVGISADRFHVGARRGAIYFDPASLWGPPSSPPDVHLVPLDGAADEQGRPLDPATSERSALLRAIAASRSGPLGRRAVTTMPRGALGSGNVGGTAP